MNNTIKKFEKNNFLTELSTSIKEKKTFEICHEF